MGLATQLDHAVAPFARRLLTKLASRAPVGFSHEIAGVGTVVAGRDLHGQPVLLCDRSIVSHRSNVGETELVEVSPGLARRVESARTGDDELVLAVARDWRSLHAAIAIAPVDAEALLRETTQLRERLQRALEAGVAPEEGPGGVERGLLLDEETHVLLSERRIVSRCPVALSTRSDVLVMIGGRGAYACTVADAAAVRAVAARLEGAGQLA